MNENLIRKHPSLNQELFPLVPPSIDPAEEMKILGKHEEELDDMLSEEKVSNSEEGNMYLSSSS